MATSFVEKAKVIEQYIAEGKMANIDVLFSHNDEMTIGALEALKQTDIVPEKTLLSLRLMLKRNDRQFEKRHR